MNRIKAPSFEKLAELFEEIKGTPRVDVIIMSPKVYGMLRKALPDMEREPTPMEVMSPIEIYIHWSLGDLIVYGSRDNKIIQTILSTCQVVE